VLGVLARAGELTMGDLAAAEKVQPPTVTRVVKGLEERGLVARTPAPTDGRQSLVGLTDAGRDLVLANRHLRDAWLSERLAELDPDERELLRLALPILTKVNHA
jgi:DNA-binding MarR family transcriptional regulator